jgi:hypothetical protein
MVCTDNALNDLFLMKNIFVAILLKWLNRLQFKIGQIETQSSHAAQFYSL